MTGEQILKTTMLSYGSYFGAKPEVVASAWVLLFSEKHKAKILSMRAIADPDQQAPIKKSLPVFYGAGIFAGLNDADITHPSGLIVIDVDKKDGENENKTIDQIFAFAGSLPYVVACSLSVRGAGAYIICRINQTKNTDEYKRFYSSISQDFANAGFETDSNCKNISRKRFCGYSGRIWVNPANVAYHELKPENKHDARQNKGIKLVSHSTDDKINWVADEIERRGLNICENYDDYFAVACSLAVEVGESGRGIFHRISRQSAKYSYENADAKYTDALRHANRSSIGVLFNKCKLAGLDTSEFKNVWFQKVIDYNNRSKRVFTYRDGSTIDLTPEGYPANWDLVTL